MPPQREEGALRSVSPDGSLVAFVSPKEGQSQLYARRNHADTVWVSKSEGSAPVTAAENVQLQYITPDNKHILFSTTSQLVDEDTNSQLDLYEYTDGPNPAAEQNLALISSGKDEGFSLEGKMLGTSNDGSSVYYVSEFSGSEGQIFLWKAGSRRLVVSRPALEYNGGVNGDEPGSKVSADGSHLVFMGSGQRAYFEVDRGLTGQIRVEHRQLYVYDADKEMLFCASCAQSAPGAEGETNTAARVAADPRQDIGDRYGDSFDTGVGYPLHRQARYLTSDGEHVFFSTAEPLVPEDKNENWDVYEYDIETGQQRLISTGRGEKPQVFAEASADGSTVWFATKHAVLAKDPDKLRDLYAARIGGGFVEPPPPTPCVGDGCRGPIPATPTDPSPSTPRFSGPGNPKPKHRKAHHHRRKKHHKKHHGRHHQKRHQQQGAK
jgi:Tol biopolymer transport system component